MMDNPSLVSISPHRESEHGSLSYPYKVNLYPFSALYMKNIRHFIYLQDLNGCLSHLVTLYANQKPQQPLDLNVTFTYYCCFSDMLPYNFHNLVEGILGELHKFIQYA